MFLFSSFTNLFLYSVSIICIVIVLRVMLHRTALIFVLKEWFHWVEDRVHVHQFFKVPEFDNENRQHNQFYGKLSTYLNSLGSMEDSDFTNLFAGRKSNDILLRLDDNQVVQDVFLGARLTWTNQVVHAEGLLDRQIKRAFVLRIKKKDKRRILRAYIQHIHTVSDEIDQSIRRERRLFLLNTTGFNQNGRWRSVPWTHPSSMDTVAMDPDLKNKVKLDLESFLKSKQYYERLGRAWRRTYLLHGPPGTGKSSFVAAMANFLAYDVYDLDLVRVDDSDLTTVLMETTAKSVVVIEGLDRFSTKKPTNLLDGIASSCCGDERVFVFTASSKETIDPGFLRPGRIDTQIHFPMCDFGSFKTLAGSYLGLRDHKLFGQVEEVLLTVGSKMSQAEMAEIMLANRGSPTRALKTLITALQQPADVARSASSREEEEERGRESGRLFKDGMAPPIKELRKLYGLLRMKSTNKIGPLDHDSTTEIVSR